MVLPLVIAGVVVAGAAASAAVVGLGLLAARKIGSAYGRTVEQVYEEQRLADYYNQQGYYQHSNYHYPSSHHHRRHHHHQRQSHGYYY